jgi:hypothetical protein
MSKYLLIAAIIAAVVSQNTCPQGWAAKTAFVGCGSVSQSSQCPMHKQKQSKQASGNDVKRSLSNVKQAFVIHIAGPDNSYEILDRSNSAFSYYSVTFTEIFLDPLLKPPIPSLFA